MSRTVTSPSRGNVQGRSEMARLMDEMERLAASHNQTIQPRGSQGIAQQASPPSAATSSLTASSNTPPSKWPVAGINPVQQLVDNFYAKKQQAYEEKKKMAREAGAARYTDPTLTSCLHEANGNIPTITTDSTLSVSAMTEESAKPLQPGHNTAAYRRAQAWAMSRQRAIEQMRNESEMKLVEDCTFHPSITAETQPPPPHQTAPIEQRLFNKQKAFEEELHSRRTRIQQQQEAECTFRPSVAPHPSHSESYLVGPAVEDRTTTSQLLRIGNSDYRDSFDPECTFQPSIGPASKLVYQTSRIEEGKMDVYTRLYSRSLLGQHTPRERSPSAERRSVSPPIIERCGPPLPFAMEEELDTLRRRFNGYNDKADAMGSFMCNVMATTDPRPIDLAFVAPYQFRRMEQDHDENEGGNQTFVAREFDWREFNKRQDKKETDRKVKLLGLKHKYAAPGKPHLCKASLKMAEERRMRVAQGTDMSIADLTASKWLKAKSEMDQDLTFKPGISIYAHAVAPRGTDDMHRDASRWKETREKAREQKEKAEKAELRPQPATNANYKEVQSMLNAANLPVYQQHLAKVRREQDEKQKIREEKKKQEAVKECSFCPSVTKPPSYISKMAHSHSQVRRLQLGLY